MCKEDCTEYLNFKTEKLFVWIFISVYKNDPLYNLQKKMAVLIQKTEVCIITEHYLKNLINGIFIILCKYKYYHQ